MTAGNLIAIVWRRMPCKGDLGSLNYTVVLIEEAPKLVARIGAGTDTRWVAENGLRLPRNEALVYFPDLEALLRLTRAEYAERPDG